MRVKTAVAVFSLLVASVPISAQNEMRIAITPSEVQFGPSPLKIPNFKNVYIYNLSTSAEYKIESISQQSGAFSVKAGDCEEAYGQCVPCKDNLTLQPGQFCAATVWFDPQRLGKFGGVITILDNNGDHILFLTGESVQP